MAKLNVGMVVYWALYLGATMLLFERFGINPQFAGGFLGWLVIEAIRVVVGFVLLSKIEDRFLDVGNISLGLKRGRRS